MHRQTYLVLLTRYQLNLRCRRRSEIMVIGQQYFNHKISFRFYIISQESLTFHPSQNLPKTDHAFTAFTAFIRDIPVLCVFFFILSRRWRKDDNKA